ncbi:ferredoxin-type protein NapG [bacterium]|nr:ferredoxin-type protein NapG [bacterium]
MERRDFLKKGLATGLVTCTSSFSLFALLGQDNKTYFRPPGALPENEFLSACIRCAKCVQACPYDTLKLGSVTDGKNAGTPFINFREKPCYLCEDLPCVKVCPTDALDIKSLVNIDLVHIGTAVITDREACLSLNGIRCEICYRVCPMIDRAITLEKHEQEITQKHTVFEPVIHKDYCTGCGICENACPLDESAITVLPSQRGDKAKHYQYLREQVKHKKGHKK